uniref:Uncharacterized protein n=1 Tax=Arundo donax TaxID=35708 RepID=A0A0A9ADK6_ARUDO
MSRILWVDETSRTATIHSFNI